MEKSIFTSRLSRVTASVALAALLGFGGSAAAHAAPNSDPDVTLCHATSSTTNPFNEITVAAAGAYNGHYRIHADDIIPPFTYNGTSYPGKNLTTSYNGHTGAQVLANGCSTTFTGGGTPPPAATPELGSGELLATGLLPIGAILLYRRRRNHRAS